MPSHLKTILSPCMTNFTIQKFRVFELFKCSYNAYPHAKLTRRAITWWKYCIFKRRLRVEWLTNQQLLLYLECRTWQRINQGELFNQEILLFEDILIELQRSKWYQKYSILCESTLKFYRTKCRVLQNSFGLDNISSNEQ